MVIRGTVSKENNNKLRLQSEYKMNSITECNRKQFQQPGVAGRGIKIPNLKETRGTGGDIQHEDWEVQKNKLERERYLKLLMQRLDKAELRHRLYEVQDKIKEFKTLLEQNKKTNEKLQHMKHPDGIEKETEIEICMRRWVRSVLILKKGYFNSSRVLLNIGETRRKYQNGVRSWRLT